MPAAHRRPYWPWSFFAALAYASPLHATDSGVGAYPNKPIRFIVPFVAGAGTDITARAAAQKMAEGLNQQVVVDNRPGASGNIGADLAAKSPPDGYTISLITATHTVNPALHKNIPYDVVRDFAPISQLTAQPYCLAVHSSIPVKSVKELIALIKAKPNFYTYGSSGTGGLSHLAGTLFATLADVKWIHVPYKGGAAGINDLLGGQISSMFVTIIGTIQHVKAGRIRWLAVSTAKRSTAQPELPTIAEAGLPGFDIGGWYGVVAPARTPKPVVDLLYRKIADGLRSPDVGQRFADDGSEPVGSTPQQFAIHIKNEVAKNAKLVKAAGMREE